ncbi:sugar phosphate isomerase/epimerase family protein [Catenovulum adriaticum]|uniref:Sugar phosphate isomerase/epimerase n=1 Tax=Catenovulum adriaticum TaxID=2984846 RepID=A0ABY7AS06_9ALTE|nr:sugar phosphate isomerase/epimerase [Catenovulum sp. TS8]WAJ72320.1 sugar phosphate isomerase/epimerase [Catenovulum sp. TS8]
MKFNLKVLLAICSFTLISACTSSEQANTVAKAKKVPPISVQLWSVKEHVKQDFKGSLTQIANMGFKGVEFAGDFGPYKNDPEGLKQFLKSLGLQASGAHVSMKQLKADKFDQTIDFLTRVGVDLVLIPFDSRAFNPEKIDELTAELTQLTKKLAKQDIHFGYHNHAQEFADFNQQTFWDHIAQNTPKNMVLQMDVGWVNFAGKDPIHYVKAYPNRTLSTHIKIRTQGNTGKNVIIGQDDFDWAKLVNADMVYGGTRWLVIEQEEYPQGLTPMQSIKASKAGLESFIKTL